MGHKVHPLGFRLGVIKDWQSKWYSETHYAEFVKEDNWLRQKIKAKYPDAAISLIEIDRQAKDITITLYTARPGIVIGRGGQRVDEMRQYLEGLIDKKIRLNIQEIRQPELDAYLVARSVAEQIERRVAYRRAMKQAIFRTIQSGAKGIKISAAGRLANAEIARRQTLHEGQVPLHTLRADIDYGFTEAHTTLGRIGVKVWIYKGQILPEMKEAEVEMKPPEAEAEAVEAGEKPAEAEATPVEAAKEEEKPAEEAAPVEATKEEEKPKEEEAPVAAVKEEEKPTEEAAPLESKKKTTKAAKAKEVKTEEKPAEDVKESTVKAEEKPKKPRTKKAVKEKVSKEPEAKETKVKETKAKETKTKETKAKATKAKATEKPAAAKKTKKTVKVAEEKSKVTKKAKATTKSKEEDKDATA